LERLFDVALKIRFDRNDERVAGRPL